MHAPGMSLKEAKEASSSNYETKLSAIAIRKTNDFTAEETATLLRVN